LLPTLVALVVVTFASAATAAPFNVRDDGAVADGQTLCTAFLQRTIDRCAAAGGGTVVFPAGTYLSGTLVLKSHVTLHLEAGATLRGSADPKDYPPHRPAVRSYTDNYVQQALIVGENLERVALTGRGTIDGNGGAFRWKEYLNRPYVIRLVKCTDVLVEGLTLRDSPMWMQHYLACDRLRFHGLRVYNHVTHNNDGLDLDGCHDVVVSDCIIDADDDALCLKSTLDRACENVTITNCVLSSHCNAFKLGTESNGGFKNITFSNCAIVSPRYSRNINGTARGHCGVALECVDGGHLENITVSNVTITGVNVPLFLRLGHRARPFLPDGPKPAVGTFRNVILSNIVATRTGRIGCSITGLPGSNVENVTLANVSFEFEGGGARELTANAVPERPDAYPESRMFGDLPAYGLYCRHVRGLRITGLRLHTLAPDSRHAVVCDDVRELELESLNAGVSGGAAPLLRFINVGDAVVRGTRPRDPLEVLLQLEGGTTRNVLLTGNDLTTVGRLLDVAADVPAGAWREAGNTTAGVPGR
jgi:polygalacturonase